MGRRPSKSIALVFSAVITFVYPIANAAEGKFSKTAPCAKAKIASGDTCSNVKVDIDFAACESGLGTKTIDKVKCEGKEITARASAGNYRAEAKFTRSDDGWGSVNWAPVGEVRSLKRGPSTATAPKAVSAKTAAAPVAAAAPVTAPAPTASVTTAPAAAAPVVSEATQPGMEAPAPAALQSSVKFSSFFDMRFTAFRSEDSTIKEKERSGYLLEDGALYANYEIGKLSGLVDIPFSRNGILGTATTSDLSFSKTKAQIYGKYSITPELSVTFGQFDTLYGVELNDSKDRVFGNVGLAYSQTLPIVHTGAFVAYASNGLLARLMVANPADRQTLSAIDSDSSTEYGATVGYANEMLRGQFGYMTRAMSNLAGGADQRSLLDILVGGTLGTFDLDVQYSVVNNPAKNTQTAAATDKEDAGTALLALLSYRLGRDYRFAVRYETIDKDPGAGGYSEAQTFGGAIHYKVQDGLTMRLEFVDTVVKRKFAADKYSESRFDIGAIVSF